MTIERDDRETTMQRSYGADWSIYSSVPRDIARLRKLAARYKRPVTDRGHGGISLTLPGEVMKIPGRAKDPAEKRRKSCDCYGGACIHEKPKRVMSAEHKAKLLEGLAKARAAKQKGVAK